jgi:hypothetical protein
VTALFSLSGAAASGAVDASFNVGYIWMLIVCPAPTRSQTCRRHARSWKLTRTSLGTLGLLYQNCFATATYLLTMRKRIKLTGFKDWDSMFYNNLLSIPILVVASIIFEDWGAESLARNFPADNRGTLLFAIAFSGAAAVFISYSTAWCIRVTSSTTYSMVGALNSQFAHPLCPSSPVSCRKNLSLTCLIPLFLL